MKVVVFNAKNYDVEQIKAAWTARVDADSRLQNLISFHFVTERLTVDNVHEAEGAIVVSGFVNCDINSSVISQLKAYGVRGIALRSAGYDRCDVKAAEAAGLGVAHVPSYSPNSVAEYAWALILCICRKLGRSELRTMEFNFSLDRSLVGLQLSGKVLGVIGTGRVGFLVAGFGRAFGMKVLCYDVYKNPELLAQAPAVEYLETYQEVLARADVISLHVPLTAASRHMINNETIKLMKPTAFLVNTGRGGLVDSAAVVTALKKNAIAGVGLDVVDEEDEFAFEDMSVRNIQSDDIARIISFRNSIVTAHQAFFTDEALHNIAQTTITNILGFISAFSFTIPPQNVLAKGQMDEEANTK